MCHFWAQNGPFVLNKIFLVQTIIITFIYLLALFIVQNLKKFFQRIQSYEDVQFLGPKWPIFPNENFFKKTVNEPCSLTDFLKKTLIWANRYIPKIKKVRYYSINEILTIKEYWNLIGQEQFLVITWEPDFSQACSFRRMLINHKNFRFTQIPDKTNGMIFLKSPKTLFLDHFWLFLVFFDRWRFFPKIWLCHT